MLHDNIGQAVPEILLPEVSPLKRPKYRQLCQTCAKVWRSQTCAKVWRSQTCAKKSKTCVTPMGTHICANCATLRPFFTT
jgi:rhodanese-related sulfurtransferase